MNQHELSKRTIVMLLDLIEITYEGRGRECENCAELRGYLIAWIQGHAPERVVPLWDRLPPKEDRYIKRGYARRHLPPLPAPPKLLPAVAES